MRRTLPLLVALLVVVGTLGAGTAFGAMRPFSDTSEPAATSGGVNDSNATVAPGERMAGVVGVQEAELDGEIDSRSFGLAIARASSEEAKASLIAAKVNETQRELGELTQQREQLRAARQNGTISQGEYRARITELAARTENVERAANETAQVSQGLPAAVLESKGVNVTALQSLRDQARNLSGGEVADIAQSIAGKQSPDQARENPGAGQRPDQSERGNAGDRGQQPTNTPTDGAETTTDDDTEPGRSDRAGSTNRTSSSSENTTDR